MAKAMATSAIERASIEKEKTGVFTGRHAINPVTGGKIPIYVADYVLMDYGTGAIMAVPGHDERDFAFAKKYGLEVIEVISSPAEYKDAQGDLLQAYSGDGVLVNSGAFDGLAKAEGDRQDHRVAQRAGEGGFRRQLQAARLAGVAAALLGGSHPHRVLRCLRGGPGARRPAAGAAAGHHRLRAQGQVASGRGRALGQHHLPHLRRSGPAGERHHGHVRRFLLVLPALRLALAGRRGLRPGGGGLLAAGGPVHRRGRARHPPPDVLALLHQGALRPGSGRF